MRRSPRYPPLLRTRNRIAELTKHRSEGGFELKETAPQVIDVQRRLQRAEKELARLTELKETRTVRWNASRAARSQRQRLAAAWRIPHGCVIEPVEDAPLSELLVKNDGGRIEAAVERLRMRLRECAADLHHVRSSPWPSSVAKAAAKELIERLADQGQPNFLTVPSNTGCRSASR